MDFLRGRIEQNYKNNQPNLAIHVIPWEAQTERPEDFLVLNVGNTAKSHSKVIQ